MATKMIGLIFSSMDSETTLALYRGIQKQATLEHFSTQGYVIYPSQNASVEYNKGEFFLFETIDFTKYDGLIVALDTISSEKTRQEIIKKLNNASIPIIAIDCDVKNCYKINTTNYESVREMVTHLIEKHGRSKINYISGPSDNAESTLRLTAYKHTMREHYLSYEGRIFEGTFFVDDGKNALDYFAQNEQAKDFDAIICGNDMGAISVICELTKRGIKVPEDVSVTGFDNISETHYSFPNVTTISKENESIGTLAIDLLAKIYQGESVPRVNDVKSSIVYRHSCGCEYNYQLDEEAERTYVNNFAFSKQFDAFNRSFIESGTACNIFSDYVNVIKEFISRVNPALFSLHILDSFTELFELDDYPSISFHDENGDIIKLKNILLYMGGNFVPLNMLPNKDQFIDFSQSKATMDFADAPSMHFLNSPLHYMEKKIGLVMFTNSEFPLMPNLYASWLNSMNITISNIYNKSLLTDLYRKDALTGLYNRFGLEYYWEKFIKESFFLHSALCIIFGDMNGLKQINDQYGHEHGDYAISIVSKAFSSVQCARLKAIRYGGDEFLLLGVSYTENEITELISRINTLIDVEQSSEPQDYKVSISVGYFMKSFDSQLDLEQCIHKADASMYQIKMEYHKQNH